MALVQSRVGMYVVSPSPCLALLVKMQASLEDAWQNALRVQGFFAWRDNHALVQRHTPDVLLVLLVEGLLEEDPGIGHHLSMANLAKSAPSWSACRFNLALK